MTRPTNGARAAIAADITPGKSRLNVLAGRRAAVNGHLRLRPRRTAVRCCSAGPATAGRTIDRAARATAGRFGFAFRPQRPGSAQLRVLRRRRARARSAG